MHSFLISHAFFIDAISLSHAYTVVFLFVVSITHWMNNKCGFFHQQARTGKREFMLWMGNGWWLTRFLFIEWYKSKSKEFKSFFKCWIETQLRVKFFFFIKRWKKNFHCFNFTRNSSPMHLPNYRKVGGKSTKTFPWKTTNQLYNLILIKKSFQNARIIQMRWMFGFTFIFIYVAAIIKCIYLTSIRICIFERSKETFWDENKISTWMIFTPYIYIPCNALKITIFPFAYVHILWSLKSIFGENIKVNKDENGEKRVKTFRSIHKEWILHKVVCIILENYVWKTFSFSYYKNFRVTFWN